MSNTLNSGVFTKIDYDDDQLNLLNDRHTVFILATHLNPIPNPKSHSHPNPKSHPKSHLNPVVIEEWKYHHSNRPIDTSRMVVFPFSYDHCIPRYSNGAGTKMPILRRFVEYLGVQWS